MSTILDEIIQHKWHEVKESKKIRPLEKIKEAIAQSDFIGKSFLKAASKKGSVNIIAEVKRGSPSKGIICHNFDHLKIAKEYERAGACAISVLTDEKFFLGKLSFLADIKKEVAIPVLRKDFIVDEYQIYEAKAAGADAILLIAAVLDAETMDSFLKLAHTLDMDALVEAHNKEELDKIKKSGAKIIGINNRNLKNFVVSLDVTKELITHIPKGNVVVTESGINTRDDVESLLACGVNAFLVGEALVKSGTITKKMQELTGLER